VKVRDFLYKFNPRAHGAAFFLRRSTLGCHGTESLKCRFPTALLRLGVAYESNSDSYNPTHSSFAFGFGNFDKGRSTTLKS
jgi:hypothetical protein